MNHLAYFWGAAGFLAGIAASFVVLRLWQPQLDGTSAGFLRSKGPALATALVFAAVAFAAYVHFGKPGMPSGASQMSSSATLPVMQASTAPAGSPGSMNDAAARLAARLSQGGGSDADWQLLKQSYEFLGDNEAAELAAQHQLRPGAASVSDATAPMQNVAAPAAETVVNRTAANLTELQQQVAKHPKDASAWLSIARLQRSQRNFAGATTAYERVIALHAMDADAWADYADASASVTGSLANPKSSAAIDAALKLQPTHTKALWLKASLAHEQHRYADAAKLWRQLRSALPEGSPDARVIDANIAEAQALATGAVPATTNSSRAVAAQPAAGAQVRGSIVVDPALQNRVAPNMTLFVFAKADDSPAPVAVYRAAVTSWPARFVLDDTQAMMPTRKLSQFDKVTVQARLSRSGQALPQAGDLQTEPLSIATGSTSSIALHISKVVP